MNRIRIPTATPSHDGDKECKCCNTRYQTSEFYDQGLLALGLYYLNCKNCNSTLTKKDLSYGKPN